jgi:hypothetical protein
MTINLIFRIFKIISLIEELQQGKKLLEERQDAHAHLLQEFELYKSQSELRVDDYELKLNELLEKVRYLENKNQQVFYLMFPLEHQ